jgi:hypothetical protein
MELLPISNPFRAAVITGDDLALLLALDYYGASKANGLS